MFTKCCKLSQNFCRMFAEFLQKFVDFENAEKCYIVLALRRLRLFASLCGLPLALPALRALSVRVCICSVVCVVSGFFIAAYVFLVDLLG